MIFQNLKFLKCEYLLFAYYKVSTKTIAHNNIKHTYLFCERQNTNTEKKDLH